MKREMLFLGAFISILIFITACENNLPKSAEIICNPPYIRFADTCCLDNNSNDICDTNDGISNTGPNETAVGINNSKIKLLPINKTEMGEKDSKRKIDYSCLVDKDCQIKNIGNCCGYYLQCVNKDFLPDLKSVQKECEESGFKGNCGFREIHSCKCIDNWCEGVLEGEPVLQDLALQYSIIFEDRTIYLDEIQENSITISINGLSETVQKLTTETINGMGVTPISINKDTNYANVRLQVVGKSDPEYPTYPKGEWEFFLYKGDMIFVNGTISVTNIILDESATLEIDSTSQVMRIGEKATFEHVKVELVGTLRGGYDQKETAFLRITPI
ncbi:MAG TPA: hypothetical protein VJH20_05030 [Candidatus Nanoarchaeia archaeon]|nr:hypothetical protein [Candidatus Nanoarchaeia archaeon]